MTEQKALKKIVRSRMERTGESYSTAHRQVTGRRAPALPAGLVPGYGEFGPGRHCESVLVVRLLRQAGIDLGEPMVCGLGGGIGFMYAVFEYAGVATPLLTIVAQHHPQPWAPAVLDRLGVPYTETHSSATPSALTKLRKALDAGRAAQCTVDRSRLPWHVEVSPLEAADPHNVIVAGIDGDTLYVDDLAPAPHEIPLTEFGTAWAAHRKGRHQMRVLGDAPAAVDLRTAVRDAIGTTVAHLTGPVLGNSFDVNFGFSGMSKLAAELRDAKGKTGWARRFGTAPGLAYVTARLAECLERAYTAPGATRPLYAEFLDEAAGVVDGAAADLTGAAELMRDSGRSWSGLAAAASHAAPPSSEVDATAVRELFDGFAGTVESCVDTERHAVELLSRVAPAH